MPLRLRLPALALAAPLVLLSLTLAAPALAATTRFDDATGDVQVIEDTTTSTSHDPVVTGLRQPDVEHVTVTTGDTLQVAVKVRSLSSGRQQLRVRFATSRDDSFGVVWNRPAPGPHDTRPELHWVHAGAASGCVGLRVVPTSAGVVVRVPRTCLDDPYRVRVGVQVAVKGRSEARDDALRTARSIRDLPTLSPWLIAT